MTVGSEYEGPTTVRSSIAARRISDEIIQHSKAQEEERRGPLDPKLKRRSDVGRRSDESGISENRESEDLECRGVKDPELAKSEIPKRS
jgi:hypothetical protein